MKYGRYEIIKEVGRGAMGVVYQAHDPEIDRMVALKVLREDRVASKELVYRFLKEAKAIGRLSHPNIVTVYDIGNDHNTIYIAMEFLEGTPLNEIITQGGMPQKKIVELGVQMADAVDYAHQKGIVHRDIKPTNIIITPAAQAKITDFGIARIEDPCATHQTQLGEILGTPMYMSPEQVMGKTVDGRSDLYSLGVILYELSTGKRPFTGSNLASVFRAITQDTPVPPRRLAVTLSPALETLVLKCLEKDPANRFQTGKMLAEALRGSLPSEHSVFASHLVPEQGAGKRKSKPAVIVTVSAVLLCAVGGFSYYMWKDHQTEITQDAAHVKEIVKMGVIHIESVPSGAQVFFNGAFQGSSPLKAQLPMGKHEIRLSLPNHYEWEAQVNLRENGETPLSVRLVPVEEDKP